MKIDKKILNKARKGFFQKFFFVFLLLFSFSKQTQAMHLINSLIKMILYPNDLLIAAAMTNDINGIQKALNKGADINTQNKHLRTALIMVIWYQNIDATNLLIKNGINIRTKEEEGNTALHVAASVNFEQVVEILIRESEKDLAYINEENNFGNTPLHLAALENSYQTAEILMENGAKIDPQNKNGGTPLHFAIIRKYREMIELLIRAGANTTIRDINRKNPIFYANREIRKFIKKIKKKLVIQRKKEELEKRLKVLEIQRLAEERLLCIKEEERKAYSQNITHIQSKLRSYLRRKKFNQEKKAIIKLQAQLKKIQIQQNYEYLKHITRMKNDSEYRERKIRKNFLSVFDKFLLNINGPIKTLSTKEEILETFKEILFIQGISTGKIFEEERSLKHLIRTFRDNQGNTALHLFAMYGKHKHIPALILNGANINTLNKNNETPLFLASESNNFKTVQTLIYLRADLNIASLEIIKVPQIYPPSYTLSQTPLSIAIKNRNKEIVHLLKNIDLNFQIIPTKKTSLDIESDPYWIFDLDEIYQNSLNQDIEKKIENFIEWLQANQNINFSKIRNQTKNNIFHYMAKYNHPQLIRLIPRFLDIDVNLNAINRKGFTPLQVAVISGNIKMAQAFVSYGAKIIEARTTL